MNLVHVIKHHLMCVCTLWKIIPFLQIFNQPPSPFIYRAILYVCYSFLFAREDCTIDKWALVLVEDLKEWNNFSWGAYAYQIMFDYVDKVQVNDSKQKYRLNGPVWVLHYWVYETFPKLAYMVAEKIDGAKFPRCLRWRQILNKGPYVPLLDKAFVSFVILYF